MFYTYILRNCNSGKYYIGHTSNLEARLKRHNSNGSKYTMKKGRWELIYFMKHTSKSEAYLEERRLKALKSRKAIEKLIKE